jgi:hypothetical protein
MSTTHQLQELDSWCSWEHKFPRYVTAYFCHFSDLNILLKSRLADNITLRCSLVVSDQALTHTNHRADTGIPRIRPYHPLGYSSGVSEERIVSLFGVKPLGGYRHSQDPTVQSAGL